MKSRALIGLVCQHSLENPDRYFVGRAYVQAVLNAGGTPIVIPYQPKENILHILDKLDGLILTGGVDVDPSRYGENPMVNCGEINPYRDELDLLTAGFALDRNLPILAICRGAQVLNVALGGTLVQDIPSQIKDSIKHWQKAPNWYASHDITVQPASLLGSILGNAPTRVNSYHHQSIAKVGKGLRIVATAPDGIVEAVESTEHRFVLGLQWHPELMDGHYNSASEIFKCFVQAASAN